MSQYFASSNALLAWLKKLAASHGFLAPRQEGKSVVFRHHAPEAIVDLAPLLKRTTSSPKAAVMPASETLMTFRSEKSAEQLRPALNLQAQCQAAPTIVFGGRPCDARGFSVLDRPYLEGPFKDPYYAAKREATVLITQACSHSFAACFCTWVYSGPADTKGSDILFTAISGGFHLVGVTEKGQKLLADAGFEDGAAKQADAEKVHSATTASLPPASILENIPENVAARFNDTAFWTEETVKCLACGACTYLCPTCQCFTITDEGSALDGRRVRSWDSCMSSLFTREASGHNPRTEKFKRMRNRISHKFSYYPQSYQGEFSCCGCGRCVVSCPVSLDIRAVVRRAVQGAPAIAKAEATLAAKPEVKAAPKVEAKTEQSSKKNQPSAPAATKDKKNAQGKARS